MNYQKHYNMLIQKCQHRGWNKSSAPEYVELHHIIPRSLGGQDIPSNIVALTAREHFIAHLLLAKIHGGKMWYAVKMMKCTNLYQNRNTINSHTYGYIRTHAASEHSQRMIGNNNPFYGKKHTTEAKAKISDANRRRTGWNHTTETKLKMSAAATGAVHTLETKEKLRLINLGKKHTQEAKAKISKSNIGKHNITHSEETKRKISSANKGRPAWNKGLKMAAKIKKTKPKLQDPRTGVAVPVIICPHCSKEGGVGAMRRWHFNNCKHRIEES